MILRSPAGDAVTEGALVRGRVQKYALLQGARQGGGEENDTIGNLAKRIGAARPAHGTRRLAAAIPKEIGGRQAAGTRNGSAARRA